MKNKKIQIRFFKKKTIEEKINSIDKKSLELFLAPSYFHFYVWFFN